jgi:hypothetical protein
MRERQWVYAWDDTNSIYLLDLRGTPIAERRCPREVVAVAGADTGEAVVAVSRFGQLWWLDANLEPQVEVEFPFDPLAVAIDAHGQYALVSSQQGNNVVCSCGGSKVGQFETNRPIRHAAFIPSIGSIVGAAEHGLVACYDTQGRHEWTTTFWSNVGALAVDGEGQTVLLACFSHGLVRLDCNGVKEGVYRFEHSPGLVAVDFQADNIITVSLDGFVTLLNYDGVIRAERPLLERPVGLALDALARYGVLAYSSGELTFFRLGEFFLEAETASAMAPVATDARSAEPRPRWQVRISESRDEIASAVMHPVPKTDRLALYTNRRTLRILDERGQVGHESKGLPGVGRVLRANDKWLTAASDSAIAAYDPDGNDSVLCTLPLHEVSHLHLYPTFGDSLVIEAREFVCRFMFPDARRWQFRAETKIESAAVLPDGSLALTFDDRNLVVYDGQGQPLGKFRAKKPEPLLVVDSPDGWVTIGLESQTVRGHEPNGNWIWAVRLPWTPWNGYRLGDLILATGAEGHCAVFDGHGTVLAQSSEARPNARYFVWSDGSVARIFHVEQTLLVTSVEGKLLWRFVAEQPIGCYEAGPAGVWTFLGRTLAYLPFNPAAQ